MSEWRNDPNAAMTCDGKTMVVTQGELERTQFLLDALDKRWLAMEARTWSDCLDVVWSLREGTLEL